MRLKAVIKGNQIKFLEGKYNFPIPVTVEVVLPDGSLESLTKGEHPVTQKIRKLMGNISSEDFDWRGEWQKHLEEKYG
ncbi:TPA: hypothetical protein EYP66_18545 [Candidatus Poribacteria bacterium]|nr:hypothetical protein [Candidatus Poribacteria bacterium]